jgi:hypothetical protein
MTEWMQEGIIETEGKKIRIVDMKKLSAQIVD